MASVVCDRDLHIETKSSVLNTDSSVLKKPEIAELFLVFLSQKSAADLCCTGWYEANSYLWNSIPRQFAVLHSPKLSLRSIVPQTQLRGIEVLFSDREKGPCQRFLTEVPRDHQIQQTLRIDIGTRLVDPILKEMITKIYQRENEFLNSHYALYHAMSSTTYCYGLMIRQMFSLCNPEEVMRSFGGTYWFRMPDGSMPPTSDEFLKRTCLLDRNPDKDADKPDHNKELKEQLLAVNPHLFANSTHQGESTFEFWTTDRSIGPPNFSEFFNKFCDHFELLSDQDRAHFSEKLEMLTSEIMMQARRFNRLQDPRMEDPISGFPHRNWGVVCQIFVPKSIIGKVAYPSIAYGFIDKRISNPKQLASKLEELREYPQERWPAVDQVRILVQHLLNPHLGIFVEEYGFSDFFSSYQGQEYMEKLNYLLTQVMHCSQQPGKAVAK